MDSSHTTKAALRHQEAIRAQAKKEYFERCRARLAAQRVPSRNKVLLDQNLLAYIESYLELVDARKQAYRVRSALHDLSRNQALRGTHAFFLIKLNSLSVEGGSSDPPRLESWGSIFVLRQTVKVVLSKLDCVLLDHVCRDTMDGILDWYEGFMRLYGVRLSWDILYDPPGSEEVHEVVVTFKCNESMAWIFSCANAVSYCTGDREVEVMNTGELPLDPITLAVLNYDGPKHNCAKLPSIGRWGLHRDGSWHGIDCTYDDRPQFQYTLDDAYTRLSECLSYELCRSLVIPYPCVNLYAAALMDLTYLGMLELVFLEYEDPGLSSIEMFYQDYKTMDEGFHTPSIRQPDVPNVPFTWYRMDGRAVIPADPEDVWARLAFNVDAVNPRVFLMATTWGGRWEGDVSKTTTHFDILCTIPGCKSLVSRGHGVGTPKLMLLHAGVYYMVRMPYVAYMLQVIGTVFPRSMCPTPLLRKCGVLDNVVFLQDSTWNNTHRYFDATAIQFNSELIAALHRSTDQEVGCGPDHLYHMPEHAHIYYSHVHAFSEPVLEIIGCTFYRTAINQSSDLASDVDWDRFYWVEQPPLGVDRAFQPRQDPGEGFF